MKKNQIISILTSITIGIVLSIGVSYLYAAFALPTGQAPTNNIKAPVNTLDVDQVKAGGLNVNVFTAGEDSLLMQKVFFKGKVAASAPVGGEICPNGKDDNGNGQIDEGCTGSTATSFKIGGVSNPNATKYTVVSTVYGDVRSEGLLGSSEIKDPTQKPLCGDDKGHVVFCPTSTSVLPKNIIWRNNVDTPSVFDLVVHVAVGNPQTIVTTIGASSEKTILTGQAEMFEIRCNYGASCPATYTVSFRNATGTDLLVYSSIPAGAQFSTPAGQNFVDMEYAYIETP